MSDVTCTPLRHTRDQLIAVRHNALPANHVRERVRLLFRRRRGCRAGQKRKTRLLRCCQSICDVDDGRIPVIIDNRSTAVPSTLHQQRREKCRRALRTVSPAVRSSSGDNVDLHAIPSLYVINAAALCKPHATEQLSVDLQNYNIDIAAVTETHFKAKHSDNIVAIPDYTLLRRDRIGRRGGGIAMYVRTSLEADIWQFSGDNCLFEVLWITIGNLFV